MRTMQTRDEAKCGERGATLLWVALSLVMFLGMAALAIDLANLFVARSEAQRTADAAALAGATFWTTPAAGGCLSTTGGCGAYDTQAKNEAISVGNKNLVEGTNPNIQTADISTNYSVTYDPRITVTVQLNSARGNAIKTFFGGILGYPTMDVAAKATAEAYNPGSGPGPCVGAYCLKPWLLPNCDYVNTSPQNPFCPGTAGYYIDTSGAFNDQAALGTVISVKPGKPKNAPAPSQFYPVDLPPGTAPAECPSTNTAFCGSLNGGGGGALYQQNIACCNTNTFICGHTYTLNMETGNMQGPTQAGVGCLIRESEGNGTGVDGTGQDYLTGSNPFTIIGGANNPNPAAVGHAVTTSPSLITMPIFQPLSATNPLCPGTSCGPSVQIVGFMQAFVTGVAVNGSSGASCSNVPGASNECNGNVDVYIISVGGCGATSGGGSGCGGGTVINGGVSPIPVRLIQNP